MTPLRRILLVEDSPHDASSREEQDLLDSYQLGVNGYVVKPMKVQDFVEAVRQVGAFWGVI